MIVNGKALIEAAPIVDMLETKVRHNGVSHGLAEIGYDIRLKQNVTFYPKTNQVYTYTPPMRGGALKPGRFCLASAMEEFQMPADLGGIVHDKSTWARKGLSVFNTVIEPGWRGFLTLELVYHGSQDLHIPAGTGIAQVIFHRTELPATYHGKYQDQANEPVPAIHA
jgi:dCTP deaminase